MAKWELSRRLVGADVDDREARGRERRHRLEAAPELVPDMLDALPRLGEERRLSDEGAVADGSQELPVVLGALQEPLPAEVGRLARDGCRLRGTCGRHLLHTLCVLRATTLKLFASSLVQKRLDQNGCKASTSPLHSCDDRPAKVAAIRVQGNYLAGIELATGLSSIAIRPGRSTSPPTIRVATVSEVWPTS